MNLDAITAPSLPNRVETQPTAGYLLTQGTMQVALSVMRAAPSTHIRLLPRSPPATRHRGVAHAWSTTRPALAGARRGARAADAPWTASTTARCHVHTRRTLLLMTSWLLARPAHATARRGASPELQRAFEQAMQAMQQGDYDAAEAAWSRCIELSPEVRASPRATHTLQALLSSRD
jgi:TolA-binding protein